VVNGPYYYVIPEHLPPALVSSPCTHHVTEVARSKRIETQAVESTRYLEQCAHSNYFLHQQETSVLKCSMRERVPLRHPTEFIILHFGPLVCETKRTTAK